MAPDRSPADTAAGARSRAPGSIRAVLLDALGTLVGLEPPAPHLVAELAARGVTVAPAAARAAANAEMAYYRAEHHRAGTAHGLAELRHRCAGILRAELRLTTVAIGEAALHDVLVASFRFFAYDDVPPVLRALRRRGLRLVICSNWDVSLHEVLERTGLLALVDGVVVSAVQGVAKPDPRLFWQALQVAGSVPAAAALHVGDSVTADVRGALAAGVAPVRIARDGGEVRSHDQDGGPAPVAPVITDLRGLLDLV